ncbi:NUDIX hydrolase [Dehalobacterium formicoaceticum]|uniref:NUDIX hydrolase n=2 Tax=Dehalobacterium formicoaceticum TaxID=51515 RepID=A0ABT1Y5H5_9FIRM|nr:NUDIX hydrolase [Dehalobacterium formicoaceticum]MCR6545813.1 NUDIX hydrolase [Dehalobacterium formicoaceticum]
MDKYEQTLESTYIYQGKILSLRKDQVQLPNGKTSVREIVEHAGAVSIVPVTEEGNIILVKQYRKPVEQETIEIPAGKLDQGERPEDCAQRELREEIGFSGDLDLKFSYYTTPGFSDELLYLYVARNLKHAPLACDDDELIEKLEVSLEEAMHMITQGEIVDAKTIIGILTLKQEGHL